MKSMTWVVWARCGTYSDTSIWIVSTHADSKDAQSAAQKCRDWLARARSESTYNEDLMAGCHGTISAQLFAECPDPILKEDLDDRYSGGGYFIGSRDETEYDVACAPHRLR